MAFTWKGIQATPNDDGSWQITIQQKKNNDDDKVFSLTFPTQPTNEEVEIVFAPVIKAYRDEVAMIEAFEATINLDTLESKIVALP